MNKITYPLHIDPVNEIRAEPGIYSKSAPHRFVIVASNNPYGQPVETIQFQDGTISEKHLDGVHNEDLLLIVRARLLAFQETEFACRENAIAITKIEEALNVLCCRTQDRRQRGVEGKSEK